MALFAKIRMLGRDGFATLLLSNLVLLISLGIPMFWVMRRVYSTARTTPALISPASCYLVPGLRLEGGQATAGFATRLQRAHALFILNPKAQIFVLGGKTDAGGYSEAEVGRVFLTNLGVPCRQVQSECDSRHTLENLRQARDLLASHRATDVVLISSRYHLARCQALATGLGLQPRLCAAEAQYQPGLALWLRMIKEAYLLHWYQAGRCWSQWTRNKRMLARIQ